MDKIRGAEISFNIIILHKKYKWIKINKIGKQYICCVEAHGLSFSSKALWISNFIQVTQAL